ncbi:MAG: hypothetical protein R3Y06_01785 [Faecalibacterium sp.]
MSPSVEPFNEVKYKALIDGLEAIEIRLSELETSKRIDSEFFQYRYLINKSKLEKIPHNLLKDIVSETIKTGHTPSMKITDYYGGNINFIKTDNLRRNVIKPIFSDKLSCLGNQKIKNSQLKENDVITTIIGASEDIIARTCLVTNDILPANINQNIALIRCNNNIIKPGVLNLYINGKFGSTYLHYLSRQTEQVNLNCEEVGRLIVPIFSEPLQKLCVDFIELSYDFKKKSAELYTSAEKMLITYLDVSADFDNEKAMSVISLSSSFDVIGRLDAEYYQPKYSNIERQLACLHTVNTLCNLYDANFNPDSNQEYKYIELSNIGLSGEINNVDILDGSELPTRARRLVKQGQVIVSSIEGSLDSCAIIDATHDEALCSTGFYVLDSDIMNSETLLVLFKSDYIQLLLKKRCSGTILSAINKDEFLSMPVPFIDDGVQKKIAVNIKESFALRSKSEELLELAKTAIEVAIEQGEDVAIRMLKGV